MTQSFVDFAAACGFASPTPAQAMVWAVAFDGHHPFSAPIPTGLRHIVPAIFGPLAHDPTTPIPPIARTTFVQVKGARVGGSRAAALRLLHLAYSVPLALAPGEEAFGLVVAPDLRLARQTLGFARGAAQANPALSRTIAADSSDAFTIRRSDGRTVAIECLPCTRGGSAVRGRSLVGAVMSEAALFRDANYVANDVDVYRALHPRIVAGGQLIVETTPWAESGLAYTLFRDNWGSPSTALAAHCPTPLMRAGDREIEARIEAERKRDPDNARREFDAVFLSGSALEFFDDRTVEAAITARPLGRPADPGARVFAAGDLGLVSDHSALAIVQAVRDKVSLLEVVELRPDGAPLKLSEVVATFAEAMKRHGVSRLMVDGWCREPAREWAEQHHVDLIDAPEGRSGKYDTYRALRDALAEGRVELPDHGRLRAQLRGITARPTSGGGMAIHSLRRGTSGHGDLVSALVLAVWQALDAPTRPQLRPETLADCFTVRTLDETPIDFSIPFDIL